MAATSDDSRLSLTETELAALSLVATELVEGRLWLGDQSTVLHHADALQQARIGVVINVVDYSLEAAAEQIYDQKTLQQPWSVFKLPLSDLGGSDLREVFEQRFHPVVTNAFKEKKRVYVHCVSGLNRSASCCLAFLMYFNNWTLRQSFEYVRVRRKISPHARYIRQLVALEIDTRGNSELDPSLAKVGFVRDITDILRH